MREPPGVFLFKVHTSSAFREKFYIRSVKKKLAMLNDFLDTEKFSVLEKICVKNLHHHCCQLVQFFVCRTKRWDNIAGLALWRAHAEASREENHSLKCTKLESRNPQSLRSFLSSHRSPAPLVR